MYQIYYDEKNGVFEKLEVLLKKYGITNFEYTYDLNPYDFSYYLVDSNFRFQGCNTYSKNNYKTITFDELERMMEEKFVDPNTETPQFTANSYHFLLKDDIHREFVIKLLEKYGFHWFSGNKSLAEAFDNVYKINPFKLVIFKDCRVDWNEVECTRHPDVSLNDLENLLKYFSENRSIHVGDYVVEFLPNKSIKVGCQTIEFDVIEKIWNKLNKE